MSVPSYFIPMTSKCIELSRGRGRDNMEKGSKRTLSWPQTLHVTFDFSWPWKRSTIKDLRSEDNNQCESRHKN